MKGMKGMINIIPAVISVIPNPIAAYTTPK